MTNETIFIAGVIIALILLIAIFSTRPKKRQVKITLFIAANIIYLLPAVITHQFIHNPDFLILSLPIGIVDICAILKIFSKDDPVQQQMYAAWHDDPANWRLGIFYYNPKDKRIFPPKRIEGLGWTINFANPYSILIMLAILIMTLVLIRRFGM